MRMHMHIHAQVFDRRFANGSVQVLERWLMGELMRRKTCWVMHVERVDVLERLRMGVLREMIVETVKGGRLMSGMQGTFGCW